MSLSFGFKQGDAKAKEVQDKIFAAAKAQHLYWLGVGAGGGPGGRPRKPPSSRPLRKAT